MAEEEEVAAEVEAVEAVYGEDCLVLHHFPPHLHVHIKPRTADVSSQQFVEAIIGIQANFKYPDEPPVISIVDSKGLDEQRQNHLVAGIRDRAVGLSSCLMLVALCEEAVEKLTSMNHPDGNCPLCLYPLLDKEMQKEVEHDNVSGRHETSEKGAGQCPVCRKAFLAKDIEHVLDLAGTCPDFNSGETDVLNEEALLESHSEKLRRQKFDAVLKLQQENSGLIEPKRHEVLLPGMFLPQSVEAPSTAVDEETKDQQSEDAAENSGTIPSGSSNRSNTSKHRNSAARRHSHRGRNSGKHARQWIQKKSGAAS